MTRLLGAPATRHGALAGLVAALVTGCAAPRIVPISAPGVEIDAARGAASVAGNGVGLVVEPSPRGGTSWDLRDYVTPFLVSVSNGAAVPIAYDYPELRLFDDSRFQYTALPPVEVERILRWRAEAEVRLAALESPPPILRRRIGPDPIDWWWDRYPWYGWYGWPWYYPASPTFVDVYRRALPMGALQPGARLEGFVYFPRLRDDARRLTFEFHHRLGELPRVLTLPFEVEQDRRGGAGG